MKNDNDIEETPASHPEEITNQQLPAEFQAKLDERDETIRLLNEALSLALDELALDQAA